MWNTRIWWSLRLNHRKEIDSITGYECDVEDISMAYIVESKVNVIFSKVVLMALALLV